MSQNVSSSLFKSSEFKTLRQLRGKRANTQHLLQQLSVNPSNPALCSVQTLLTPITPMVFQ
jgi:hypothetical protein